MARFPLHPRLAPLLPWFARGEMSVAVATGAPEIDRHHTTARRALERAIVKGAFGSSLEPSIVNAALGSSLERWPDERSEPDDPRMPLDERMRRVARDVRLGVGRRLRVVPSSGWDTHVGQGDGHRGRLAELVGELVRGESGPRLLPVLRRELEVTVSRPEGNDPDHLCEVRGLVDPVARWRQRQGRRRGDEDDGR